MDVVDSFGRETYVGNQQENLEWRTHRRHLCGPPWSERRRPITTGASWTLPTEGEVIQTKSEQTLDRGTLDLFLSFCVEVTPFVLIPSCNIYLYSVRRTTTPPSSGPSDSLSGHTRTSSWLFLPLRPSVYPPPFFLILLYSLCSFFFVLSWLTPLVFLLRLTTGIVSLCDPDLRSLSWTRLLRRIVRKIYI